MGKRTLTRQVLAHRDAKLLSLDVAAVFNAAKADPDALVRQMSGLLGVDEVQRVPELVRAMKDAVEEDHRSGRFLITGSANLLELRGTQESLAGRAETDPLYGLSRGEAVGKQEDFVDLLMSGDAHTLSKRHSSMRRNDYLEILCAGSYPEPMSRAGRRRNAWFDNYLGRIVGRDARHVSRLAHLGRLPALIRLLAANNAGELAKARIATDSGIPETSVPSYVDLLQTPYLIHQVPAWGNNLTGRVTVRPRQRCLTPGSQRGSTTSALRLWLRAWSAMRPVAISRRSRRASCAVSSCGRRRHLGCFTSVHAPSSRLTSSLRAATVTSQASR